MTSTLVHAQRRRLPTAVAVMLLLALLVIAVIASLSVGSRSIPPSEIIGALFGGLDSDNATVITTQRVPRTLLGLAAGACLGLGGALMQGHTRNPLADPGLFGVNAGASLGVALTVFAMGTISSSAIVIAALVGAGAAATIVFAFGLRDISSSALVMLAVVGTTLAALLSAITSMLVLMDANTLDVLRFWDVGSLVRRNLDLAGLLAVLMAVGVVLALQSAFSLNALGLGADVATTLGSRVALSRVLSILAITLLAGSATALCGPISFLGLVAPHLARALAGHDYRKIVPFAGIIGATLILAADTLGRVSVPNGELQVGIVLAVLGGPGLLVIARRRRVVAL